MPCARAVASLISAMNDETQSGGKLKLTVRALIFEG